VTASNDTPTTVDIQLRYGGVCVVDHSDVDLACKTWTTDRPGYVVRFQRQPPKTIRIHRVIAERMLGRPLRSDEVVDHADGGKLNNRRENLRVTTQKNNARNARRSKVNSSGYKGVSFHAQRKKWRALIRIDGKRKSLGEFDTPEQAYAAYCKAAIEHFGEYARLE
jgi:hypothetical protein